MTELQTETKKTGERPDYKGQLDVAAWVNKDKNGKQYISLKIANKVNLFVNAAKEKKE